MLFLRSAPPRLAAPHGTAVSVLRTATTATPLRDLQ